MREYTAKIAYMRDVLNPEGLSMRQVKERTGCDIIHAAHWWNTGNPPTPTGNYKVDGAVLSSEAWHAFGYAWNEGELPTMTMDMAAKDNFICTMPLIADGKKLTLYPDAWIKRETSRPASGFDAAGLWHLVLFDSATPWDVQDYMLGLGCVSAMMWDGGGSTKAITPDWTEDTARVLQNYMCVWLAKGEETESQETEGKMKIYLSPSSQSANAYADGGTTEQEQCNRIAEAARTALERCGFAVKKAPEGQAYAKNIAESNEWGADLHVPIHTNAGGGHGPIVFVYGITPERLKYARPVYEALNDISPIKSSYGVRAKSLDETAKTGGLCIYCECAFHDNAAEANWIIAHTGDIGEAICRGICRGAGTPYAPPQPPSTLEERVDRLETWAEAMGMK